MPGLLGTVRLGGSSSIPAYVIDTIDLLHNAARRVVRQGSVSMAAAFFEDGDANIGSIQRDGFIGFLFGDPVRTDAVDWDSLLAQFRRAEFGGTRDIEGIFGLALYDINGERLYLATDKIGMQPLYYAQHGREITFSTALPTFVRLGNSDIDRRWVSEFLFFNYALSTRTFLKGVSRLPAATVLQFDTVSGKRSLTRYCEPLSASEHRISGEKAVHAAYDIMAARIPGLLGEGTGSWISITAGLDSRTTAAFVPAAAGNNARMYTYGRPGCRDILEGRHAAHEYGFPHVVIELDTQFESKLLNLMAETIWLSGGTQKINRAHLCAVYRSLGKIGRSFPAVLSGISGDHVFRDHQTSHGNVPHIIAPETSAYITKRTRYLDTCRAAEFLRTRPDDGGVADYLQSTFSSFIENYGDPVEPTGYFSYLVYAAAPMYFGGELALARNFVRLRSPFWDHDLLRLAYDMDCSTVGLSVRFPAKDKFRETQVQSSLIVRAARGRAITYRGLPIDYFARGNRFWYQLARTKIRGIERLRRWAKGKTIEEMETWDRWLRPVGRLLDSKHGQDAFVHEYVSDDYIYSAVDNHDLRALAALGSLELIFSLVDNGWVLEKLDTEAR